MAKLKSDHMDRILLLMKPGENRQLLSTRLSTQYRVLLPADNEPLSVVSFDLCIIDYSELYQHTDFLRKKKQSQFPVHLPVLCLISRSHTKSVDNLLGEVVDEMILTPIEKVVLDLRIKNLLQQRLQSRELKIAKEAAKKANANKSAFLSNISHEIRTPLNGIIGCARLLNETQLSQDQKSYGHTIQKSAESLLSLVNDILDVSRIEAGKYRIESIDFDLNSIISDVCETLSPQTKQKNLKFEISIPSDLPCPIIGDPNRLRQIFMNLAGNAVKFTEKGSVRIQVLKENETESHIGLLFEIIDTGIGINDDQKTVLFKSFSQADTSTTRIYGGSGLGLFLAKQLIEIMNGTIGFESESSKGSLFWFRLQFGKNHKIEACDAEKTNGYERTTTSKKPLLNILVVEDYPVNQQIILANLKDHRVSLAVNGVEALEMLKKKNFDMVLMDIQMPEMDGYQATRNIRDTSSGVLNPQVPIIALTAHVMDDERKRCQEAGMNDFIGKPFRSEDLNLVIERWAPDQPDAFMTVSSPSVDSVSQDFTSPIVHFDNALKAMGGRMHILEQVCRTFAEDIPNKIETCRKAIENKDFQTLERCAHSVKSASKSICAQQAAEISFALEQAAGRKDANLGDTLFSAFESHLKQVVETIGERFSRAEACH